MVEFYIVEKSHYALHFFIVIKRELGQNTPTTEIRPMYPHLETADDFVLWVKINVNYDSLSNWMGMTKFLCNDLFIYLLLLRK